MADSSSNSSIPLTTETSAQGTQEQGDDVFSNSSTQNETMETLDQVNSEEVVAKNLKSVVWSHFVKKKINGIDKAVCKYCQKILGGASKNGTSHLHDHFRRCPRRTMPDIRQKVLINNLQKKEMNSYAFDQDIVRQELANMVVMHEYPIACVEHIGFRRYSTTLQPLFKVPSRNTVKNDILKIFDRERGKTMKVLEQNVSRVAITTDMWTSSNQKRGFMAITAHFIDGSWTMQSRILRFMYVPSPHTSEVLCDALVDCLMDWGIDTKLSTITVDNCTTNDALLNLVKDKLDKSKLIRYGSLLHMRCCAHILNLIVRDGLDIIKNGIEHIRDSVVFWTATPKRLEKFEEAARQLRISINKKLCLDCPTRWNSTFLMLRTAILYKDVFVRLKQREHNYKTLPSDDDWKLAREICERLKVFYKVTELFSGTKYPTANMYFPNICEIKLEMKKWLVSESEIISTMAATMVLKFDKYWGVIHEIMGVAAVLDPRYKMTLLEWYFPKVYGSGSSIQIQHIRDLCCDLMNDYQSDLNWGVSESDSTIVDITHSDKGNDPLTGYDLFVRQKKRSRTSYVKSELDNYLDEEVLPRSDDFNILLWWKIQGVKYPTLRAMARDVLAIPVSTVASESAFSTSGRIVSPHRNRLVPKTLEALMCGRSWLWAAENKAENSQNSDGYATMNDDMDSDVEETFMD